jgi:hypothetical protein
MALPTNVATPSVPATLTNIQMPIYEGFAPNADGSTTGVYRSDGDTLRARVDGTDRIEITSEGIKVMQGGAVTQATDKGTGVTLSKATGEITMNGAALNAGTIVSFTLTNTLVDATDVLILNHVSGGTLGSYTLNAACAAESAVIYVRNNTAGALSEAIVIRYVLIKGATS